MEIRVSLPLFEGPLDLLLHLIKQNKIDIYDIPIALITKQYLDYIELMRELDLEIASDFLVMAATLIYIKSRMLLPRNEEEAQKEDPRKELVEQLIEYEKFKKASNFLNEQYQFWSKVYSRKKTDEEEIFIDEVSIYDLFLAIKKLIEKSEIKIFIPKEVMKVEDKINHILELLKVNHRLYFDELFEVSGKNKKLSKIEIIVTFLALLELIRLRIVKAYQEITFGKIYIQIEEGNHVNSSYL